MNRDRDFDETMADWLDDGADRSPERFVWAALEVVERTTQRGAWRVSLEEAFKDLKPAGPILGAAAILGLAVVAFQFVGGPNVADPSPTATPRLIKPAALPEIIVTEANIREGLTVYRTLTGVDALGTSNTAPEDSPGFVDALLTDFDGDDDHEGDHEDRYRTYAAVFETVADAERAFDAAVVIHESPDAWGFWDQSARPGYDPDPGLGDDSVHYTAGMDYGFPELRVYLWRVDNVLLQAIDFHPYDRPNLLESIAEGMHARASGE